MSNYYCYNITVHEVNWLRNRHIRVAPVLLPAKNSAESTGSDVYWREQIWRKRDFFMLDDTAMDFVQGQIVKLFIDVLRNIKV